MFTSIIFLIIGFVFLVKGADVMIEGSSSIARKLGVSSFVIGMTVVAFGTSLPELMVSALASFKGSAGIALGNIIGSNISNTLLILGSTAIIAPLLVKKEIINREIPFSLLAILAVGFMVNDLKFDHKLFNELTRIDGVVLILFFTIFIYYTFFSAKNEEGFLSTLGHENPKEFSLYKSVLMVVAGLIGLALGGQWIVGSAQEIARFFGLSEVLIGLTIVAVGTSLPELAASVTAALKSEPDLAVGNVVGSNIFNLLWVLGVSSAINPIKYETVMNVDVVFLFFITILLLFLIYFGKKNILGRLEGIFLLGLYIVYVIYLVYRG